MVIEQVGKSKEKHRLVRFILSAGRNSARKARGENALARKLVFFELNSLAIMDLARDAGKRDTSR